MHWHIRFGVQLPASPCQVFFGFHKTIEDLDRVVYHEGRWKVITRSIPRIQLILSTRLQKLDDQRWHQKHGQKRRRLFKLQSSCGIPPSQTVYSPVSTISSGLALLARQTRAAHSPEIRDMREVNPAPVQPSSTIQRLSSTDVRVRRRRRVARPELEALVHVSVAKGRSDHNAVVLVRDAVKPRCIGAGSGEGRVQEVGKGWIAGSRFAVCVDRQIGVGSRELGCG